MSSLPPPEPNDLGDITFAALMAVFLTLLVMAATIMALDIYTYVQTLVKELGM